MLQEATGGGVVVYSFQMPTQIKIFDSVREFLSTIIITEKDLLITNARIFEPNLKDYNINCRVVFQENYGEGEPSDSMVSAIINDLRGYDFERVLALGGGTIIDIGKIIALSPVTNIADVIDGRVAPVKGHKMIAVPTNCCNGSEVSNIAIIIDSEGHGKKAIVGQALYPDEAALVPELLKGLPPEFFALGSMDALVTAIESFLAPTANPVTEIFAQNAIQKILGSYKNIAKNGLETYREDIGQVLVGSNFAGIAFCNTGVGAVHALSYPFGGKYHVAHGEATYTFIGGVLRKYDELDPGGKINELKKVIADALGDNTTDVFVSMAGILNGIIPLKRLRDYGVQQDELAAFAEEVMSLERLMKNNYVRLNIDDVLDIYNSRY